MPHSCPLHILCPNKTRQVLKENIEVLCRQQFCVSRKCQKCILSCAAHKLQLIHTKYVKTFEQIFIFGMLSASAHEEIQIQQPINELSDAGRRALESLEGQVVGELQPELRLWPTEHLSLSFDFVFTSHGNDSMFRSLQDFH